MATRFLWLWVTQDKYSLPLAVADSGSQLARMCGVRPNSIARYLCLSKEGKTCSRPRYIKVEVDDEEDCDGGD